MKVTLNPVYCIGSDLDLANATRAPGEHQHALTAADIQPLYALVRAGHAPILRRARAAFTCTASAHGVPALLVPQPGLHHTPPRRCPGGQTMQWLWAGTLPAWAALVQCHTRAQAPRACRNGARQIARHLQQRFPITWDALCHSHAIY